MGVNNESPESNASPNEWSGFDHPMQVHISTRTCVDVPKLRLLSSCTHTTNLPAQQRNPGNKKAPFPSADESRGFVDLELP